MENSFFEYRDKTGAETDSDGEIIDDSMVLETVPYSVKKKGRPAFVPESDESMSNEGSRRSNIWKPSDSQNNVVVSSSEDDEGEYSPEIVPKRRPALQKYTNPNGSLILQRNKKRMLFQDSDTDNSIIIEQRKNNKQKCLKDTPLKIEGKIRQSDINDSVQCESAADDDDNDDEDETSDDDEDNGDESKHSNTGIGKKCKKLVISSDDSETENVETSKKHITANSAKLKKHAIISDDSSGDENEIIDSNNDTNNKSKKIIKHAIISDDDDENDNDESLDHTNDDNYDKDQHRVSGNESSDDDNDISESKITNAKTNTIQKYKVNSEESSDDDESNRQTQDVIKKSEKLRMDSKDSNLAKENSILANKTNVSNDSHKSEHDYCSKDDINNDIEESDDDGPDEDMMVMSRATRMSIMGVIPKDNDSDDSDYIQSDSSSRKTNSRTASLEDLQYLSAKSDESVPNEAKSDNDLPEVTISQHKTNDDDDAISIQSNDSRISCSPFGSPLQDITNKSIDKREPRSKTLNSSKKLTDFMDLTVMPDMEPKVTAGVVNLSNIDANGAKNKTLDNSLSVLTKGARTCNDDEVTIIEPKPEVIALSSDDEDEVSNKSQKAKSPAQDEKRPDIQRFLVPSRPGQVVYVKKHVKENELNKLMRLKEDLNSVRMLLDEMDLESLPDGGSKLLSRHGALEAEVRRQGDRVANMVVEPDQPTAADIAKDGFNAGLSWEDIQKASNAVQPRMFGKQAMATHMAERSLIVDRLRDLHAALRSRPAETALAAAPRLLRSTLLPYQRHALAWLQWRETQKPAAGILADDMGLGKTITMISLIASDKQDRIDHGDDPAEKGRDKLVRGGTLVVCPASLIQQWASEVTKHCTSHALSVCLHHGSARATAPHRLATHDMVATTYNILQRDSDKNGVLTRIQWRRIILDEAHIVRNHKSATSSAVSALHGGRRWCLTGTPVHNKDLDLFALLKFLRLSPFDDLQMWKKWIDNKSQGGQERLNIVMQCILLRRTKAQLQETGQLACLPERTVHVREVTLASDEMNVYQKVLVLSKTLFAQFLHQRAEKNSGTSFAAPAATAKDSEYAKMHKRMIALQGVNPVKSHEILVLLLRLRQVCCHCGLIGSMLDAAAPGAEPDHAGADLLRELDKLSLEDSRRKSNNRADEAEEEVEASAKADEAIRAVLAPNHPVFQLDRPSSKIQAVMDCLDKDVFSKQGDKAVVVSQWTSVLRLVEQELNKKKIKNVTLSGAVPVSARPNLINAINDPKNSVKVMLLSLCAGGVGINLCGANHLLLLDPHWNPQLEEQARDRVYRIGQSKPVHVYRFVCIDTVEQTIRRLQDAKLELADNVLTGAGNKAGSPLSVEELKMLFNMGS